jgi:hypothetical protein
VKLAERAREIAEEIFGARTHEIVPLEGAAGDASVADEGTATELPDPFEARDREPDPTLDQRQKPDLALEIAHRLFHAREAEDPAGLESERVVGPPSEDRLEAAGRES